MKIKVYALLKDGQDGGYSVTLYPSKSAMVKDQKNFAEEMEVKFDETDEYQFGYRAHNPIEIEVDEKGKMIGMASAGFGQ
jgi:uncharacterized protein YuzE